MSGGDCNHAGARLLPPSPNVPRFWCQRCGAIRATAAGPWEIPQLAPCGGMMREALVRIAYDVRWRGDMGLREMRKIAIDALDRSDFAARLRGAL